MMTISISVAGDFFLSDSLRDHVSIGPEVASVFSRSDLAILNLEAPVIDKWSASQEIPKDGPHLRMGQWVLDFISKAGVSAVCLANNHIMDYGQDGLLATIGLCDRSGLRHVGAGRSSGDAAAPLFFEAKGKTIGVLAVCENEWSVAVDEFPGAHGFDFSDSYSSVVELRKRCDFLVIVFHGGNEHYHLPSPRVKKTMRFLIDIGADAVVMHHSHCISGMEVYKNRPIFYGLGNFFFSSQGKAEGWYRGLVVDLSMSAEGSVSWQTHFVSVEDGGRQLTLADGDLDVALRKEFARLSEIISDDSKLSDEWRKFVERSSPFYYQILSSVNLLPTAKLRGLARRLGVAKYLLPRRHLVHLINYITCESHLDVSRAVLSKRLRG